MNEKCLHNTILLWFDSSVSTTCRSSSVCSRNVCSVFTLRLVTTLKKPAKDKAVLLCNVTSDSSVLHYTDLSFVLCNAPHGRHTDLFATPEYCTGSDLTEYNLEFPSKHHHLTEAGV